MSSPTIFGQVLSFVFILVLNYKFKVSDFAYYVAINTLLSLLISLNGLGLPYRMIFESSHRGQIMLGNTAIKYGGILSLSSFFFLFFEPKYFSSFSDKSIGILVFVLFFGIINDTLQRSLDAVLIARNELFYKNRVDWFFHIVTNSVKFSIVFFWPTKNGIEYMFFLSALLSFMLYVTVLWKRQILTSFLQFYSIREYFNILLDNRQIILYQFPQKFISAYVERVPLIYLLSFDLISTRYLSLLTAIALVPVSNLIAPLSKTIININNGENFIKLLERLSFTRFLFSYLLLVSFSMICLGLASELMLYTSIIQIEADWSVIIFVSLSISNLIFNHFFGYRFSILKKDNIMFTLRIVAMILLFLILNCLLYLKIHQTSYILLFSVLNLGILICIYFQQVKIKLENCAV